MMPLDKIRIRAIFFLAGGGCYHDNVSRLSCYHIFTPENFTHRLSNVYQRSIRCFQDTVITTFMTKDLQQLKLTL
jgi:hypothetical protein